MLWYVLWFLLRTAAEKATSIDVSAHKHRKQYEKLDPEEAGAVGYPLR